LKIGSQTLSQGVVLSRDRLGMCGEVERFTERVNIFSIRA